MGGTGSGVWWCFFVARYISKIFELLFLAKKSHGAGEWGMVVFFCRQMYFKNN
jgi:hypothetical protein